MEDDEYEEGMEVGYGGHHRGSGHGGDTVRRRTTRGVTAGGGTGTRWDEDMEGDGDLRERGGDHTQEDAWAVISAYFEEKGLVRQQLDLLSTSSFRITMQEIVRRIATESDEIR
ncbi:hypothetical protein PR202_ga02638 [Eleusine coracana subsp. coracana]|uniref:DNA-directed RNA polymerase n=1 Tax=Eleusine coracana subsp. coracana TaxID=191504 RepID=A0AAV5BM89_ELECO|nr:hypothetical protein PR202_ga02638 [Eleusine coracana subsp. coracana]